MKGIYEKGRKSLKSNVPLAIKLGIQGNDIGPILSSIGEKLDQKGLLNAILDPSAAIVFGYESVKVKTKSGQTLYGFLLSEGETTVLKDMAGNKTVIKGEEIESTLKMETSIMPDAITLGLTEQDLADLSTYLLNLTAR